MSISNGIPRTNDAERMVRRLETLRQLEADLQAEHDVLYAEWEAAKAALAGADARLGDVSKTLYGIREARATTERQLEQAELAVAS